MSAIPVPNADEARDNATYEALMWALARPGEVQRLAAGTGAANAAPVSGAGAAPAFEEHTVLTGAGMTGSPAKGADMPAPSDAAKMSPASPLAAIALALVDLEVSSFTDDPALAPILARTGSRGVSMAAADYLFLTADPLPAARAAKTGSGLHPETAATLIVAAATGGGARLRISGPGIDGAREIAPAINPELWAIRARAAYPLGFDLFIVEGDRVIGLPRSVTVEVL